MEDCFGHGARFDIETVATIAIAGSSFAEEAVKAASTFVNAV
jgi:hypothetical protein